MPALTRTRTVARCGWAIAIAIAGLSRAAAGHAESSAQAAVDQLLARHVAADAPGCVLGVASNGQPMALARRGMADLEWEIPITADTLFEAGSASKQVLAAIVVLLAREGKLGLQDDVRTYLPELPRYDAPITIEQMLNHTSGLRSWDELVALEGWPRGTRAVTNEHLLQLAARQRGLNFTPGSSYGYSNTNYNLLAILVSRVSGRSLAELSRARLFEPLGMRHTTWRDDFNRVLKRRAIAYQRTSDGYEQNMPFEYAYGNGGLITTVQDLLTWNQALADGRLGSLAQDLERRGVLNDGTQINYARGLFILDYRSVREVSHSGGTGGYRAWLARYPSQRLSVAVLCNASDADAVTLGREAASVFLVNVPPLPHAPAIAPTQLAALVGLYVSRRTSDVLRIDLDGSSLKLDDESSLRPLSATEFFDGRHTYTFAPPSLRVTTREGLVFDYQRTTPWTATAPQLAAYAGGYHSPEAAAQLQIASSAGQLTLRDAGGRVHTLAPTLADVFESDHGYTLRFIRDDRGRVSGFDLDAARLRGVRFQRAEQ